MGRFLVYQALGALVFLLVGRVLLRKLPRPLGLAPFALWNLAFVALFWFWSPGMSVIAAGARIAVYALTVAVHFLLMRRMAATREGAMWPSVLYPIALLVLFKYARILWVPLGASQGLHVEAAQRTLSLTFIGLSYMAFRLSHFAVEVRNGVVRMPTFWEHLAFAFFVPTMPVGPISPGSVFLTSLDGPDPARTPVGRSVLRILVGATKYLFLAGVLGHITYADLIGDGHPHAGPIDGIVSAVGYYLYLYCNFSGFCDLAIGGAGLMGISVVENFDFPLVARNIRDFWSRWHISLSNYVRDLLFTPLSKILAGKMPVQHGVALALLVTFIVTGVWHGVGLNFFLFGLFHAVGMVAHHYYVLFLRKRLSREQLRRYGENAVVRGAATLLTFAFVTVSFFFFANDLTGMKRILQVDANFPESVTIGF
jgi:membrane protein involved in D-alanine export